MYRSHLSPLTLPLFLLIFRFSSATQGIRGVWRTPDEAELYGQIFPQQRNSRACQRGGEGGDCYLQRIHTCKRARERGGIIVELQHADRCRGWKVISPHLLHYLTVPPCNFMIHDAVFSRGMGDKPEPYYTTAVPSLWLGGFFLYFRIPKVTNRGAPWCKVRMFWQTAARAHVPPLACTHR